MIGAASSETTKADLVSTLLPELLLHIVRESCPLKDISLRSYVSHLSRLSGVCRHWRSVVLGTRVFWTKVQASDEPRFPWDALELFMKRAFDTRAHIDMTLIFEKSREGDRLKLFEVLAVYQAFLSSLKVSWAYWPFERQQDITLVFPAAQSLKLELPGASSLFLDLSHSSRLQELDIRGLLRLHVGHMRFNHLSSITLSGNGYQLTGESGNAVSLVDTVHEVLRAASSCLQSLRISHYRAKSAGKADNASECLDLPHLESLSLTALDTEVVATLLHRLRCPALVSLHIAAYREPQPIAQGVNLDTFLFSARRSLRSLSINNLAFDELRRSLARSTELRTLSVAGYNYPPEFVRLLVAELTARDGRSHAVCPKLYTLSLEGFDFSSPSVDVEFMIWSRSLAATAVRQTDEPADHFHVAFHRCFLRYKLKELELARKDDSLVLTDCCYF